MKRTLLTLILAGALLMALVVYSPTLPAAAIDPTLDAALYAIAQATAQAGQVVASQRSTAAAVSSEATRQANIAQATARALSAEATRQAQSAQAMAAAQSAQATQSALDELDRQRAMTATAQVMSIEGTRTTRDATATAEAMNAQATQQANVADATRQAMTLAAQATDVAHTSATYATRQERFTLGLLVVEILFVCGAAWVLLKIVVTLGAWAVKMRPQADPTFAGILTSATAQPSASGVVIDQAEGLSDSGRMPPFVQVNDDPRMVEAIDRWAEKYDDEHATLPRAGRGGNNGH